MMLLNDLISWHKLVKELQKNAFENFLSFKQVAHDF